MDWHRWPVLLAHKAGARLSAGQSVPHPGEPSSPGAPSLPYKRRDGRLTGVKIETDWAKTPKELLPPPHWAGLVVLRRHWASAFTLRSNATRSRRWSAMTPRQGRRSGRTRTRRDSTKMFPGRRTSKNLSPYYNDFVVHKGFLYGFDGTLFVCLNLEHFEAGGVRCFRSESWRTPKSLITNELRGFVRQLSARGGCLRLHRFYTRSAVRKTRDRHVSEYQSRLNLRRRNASCTGPHVLSSVRLLLRSVRSLRRLPGMGCGSPAGTDAQPCRGRRQGTAAGASQ